MHALFVFRRCSVPNMICHLLIVFSLICVGSWPADPRQTQCFLLSTWLLPTIVQLVPECYAAAAPCLSKTKGRTWSTGTKSASSSEKGICTNPPQNSSCSSFPASCRRKRLEWFGCLDQPVELWKHTIVEYCSTILSSRSLQTGKSPWFNDKSSHCMGHVPLCEIPGGVFDTLSYPNGFLKWGYPNMFLFKGISH